MTAPITAKTCEAWFLLEAADLRGLPAPFSVRVTEGRTEMQVRTVAEFDRWVEELDAEPTRAALLEFGVYEVVGELLDLPVSVFVCVSNLAVVAS